MNDEMKIENEKNFVWLMADWLVGWGLRLGPTLQSLSVNYNNWGAWVLMMYFG